MTAAFSDTPASMLERFTAIIDSFTDDAAVLTLDQIAMRTGLPRSTTHRILDQLVRLRWIGHGAGGYRLGERTAGGRSQAGTVDEPADVRLRTAAAPVLHELQLGTGAVVHLGLLERGRIVHLDKLGGAGARRVPTAVGDWHSGWPPWQRCIRRKSSPKSPIWTNTGRRRRHGGVNSTARVDVS